MTAILCPHCDEPTVANRLPDGSVICSCAAARPLPPPAPNSVVEPAPIP